MPATIYDLAGRAPREGGETVLGLKDLGTHACYMLYGVVAPGEAPRTLSPGVGHEEIVLVLSGGLKLEGPGGSLTLQAGQALYMKGEETWQATCLGPLEARYAAAGGHTPGDDHHHHH
jgi:uncharacterized cupin superfamily protein